MALEQAGLEWLNENLPAFLGGIEKANRGMADVGDTAGGTGGRVNVLQGIFTGFATALTTAVFGAIQKVSGALISMGQDVVMVAADFQSQMTVLSIAASGTGLALDELHDAAIAVGADTTLLGVSAAGAADSMTGLYKAGLTTVEIFGDLQGYLDGTAKLGGALRASIDLAAASELDMVQASDLAAIALATFGGELETEEERATFIEDAMNNLVMAADASVASVSGLSEGLRNFGPVAASFGFSLEETNNALAILSTRGIQGSEAGTALRSMFTNIMRPTNKVQEALADLGVVLYDSEGNMLSMVEIVGQFEVALGDVSQEQKNQYIQTLAGTYGMRAMNTLLGEGVEGWYDMAEATGSAATIQEQAAARAQTFAGQMEALEGTVETAKIAIGEAFLPVLTEVMSAFSELISEYGPKVGEFFGGISEAIQPVVAGIGEFAAALSSGLPPLEALGEAFDTYLPEEMMDKLWDVLLGIQDPINAFSDSLSEGEGILMALNKAFGELGLSDLAAEMGTLMVMFDPTSVTIFKDAILGLVSGTMDLDEVITRVKFVIQEAFGLEAAGTFQSITDAFQTFKDFVVEHGDEIKAALAGIGAALAAAGIISTIVGIVAAINPLTIAIAAIVVGIGTLAAAWEGDWGGIRSAVTEAWEGVIQPALESAKAMFTEEIAPALQEAKDAFGEAFGTIGEILGEFGIELEGGGSIIKVVVGLITRNVVGLIVIFTTIFRAIASVVRFFADYFRNQMNRGLAIIEGVKGIFTSFRDFFVAIFEKDWQAASDAFLNIFRNIWKVVSNLVMSIVDAITMPFRAVFEFIKGFIQGIIDFFVNLKDKLVGHSIVTDMMEKIWSTITGALETIRLWWETIWNVIKGFLLVTWTTMVQTVKDKLNAMRTWIMDKIEAIRAWWERKWNEIKDFLLGIWDAIVTAVTEKFGEVKTTILIKIDEIIQAIVDYKDEFIQVGKDIIEGMKEGIQAAFQGILSFVRGAIQGIIREIEDLLEIESPSGVFADIGKSMGEGLKLGLQASLPDVQAQISAMVMPSMPAPAVLAPAPAAPAPGPMTYSFGPNYINNDVDAAMFDERVRQVVTKALR